MAKAELGVKRRCLSCNTAFFDLDRVPIICPKCAVAFQVVEIAHSPPRRASFRPTAIARPAPAEPVAADAVLLVDEEERVVSAIAPTKHDNEIDEIEEGEAIT
jgi:uncharacterized protein (TIGR02300 family)